MRVRPTEVSAQQQAAFDAHMQAVRNRVLDRVEPVLAPLDPELQDAVYRVAFTPNEVLPKRDRRPHVLAAHLAEQVYLAHDESSDQRADGESGDGQADELGDRRAALLDFTVLLQEYCDIFDDVIDGDVAEGHEERALAVTQFLLPLLVGRLNDLGPQAVDYWTRRVPRLNRALLTETREAPDAETYTEVLDGQSALFGIPTGLAAVAADCDEATVEQSEAIGELVFQYAQVALDLDQHEAGTDETWNAATLLGREAALDRLDEYTDRLETLLDPLPDEHAQLIATALAVDTDQWDG
jgi:hypothetical protein